MKSNELLKYSKTALIIAASLLIGSSVSNAESCDKDHQFLCDRGKCIPVAYRCDGTADCGTGDYSDENFCDHNEHLADEFLVVATNNKNIYQLQLKTGKINRLLPVDTPSPVAVAIDMENKDIYYTDVSLAVIGKIIVDYDGSKAMTIIYTDNTGGAVFDGLAIDYLRKKLYYSNAGLVGSIGEMSTDGSKHRDLIMERGRKPRALVIDVNNRLLYWTDWGDSPSINVLDVVSGKMYVLISTGLIVPNALFVDFTEETMTWADAGTHRLESAGIDGSDRTVLYTNSESHFFGMALMPTHFYITDWNKHYVHKVDFATRTLAMQPPITFTKPMGIAAYYSITNSSYAERLRAVHNNLRKNEL